MKITIGRLFVLSSVLALALTGCGEPEPAAGAPPAGAPAGRPGGGPPGGGGIPVVAYTTVPETVERYIELIGSLAANERVEVQSKIPGIIEAIHFAEGDHVEAGQILFELDRRDREASLEEAKANLELARLNLERTRTLFASNSISEQELDRGTNAMLAQEAIVRLREQNLRDAYIRAPFAGSVGARMASIGQFVTAGSTLTTVVDLQPIKIDFEVPERYLTLLSVGQELDVNVVAYPGQTFRGRVYFVSPEVDLQTRTLLVRAEIPNEDERLKPGMFGSLRLLVENRDDAIVIPEEAVMQRGRQSLVAVVNAEGKAEFRPIELGLRLEGRVEVTGGLQMGDKIVTEGHQKFGPGTPVRIVRES